MFGRKSSKKTNGLKERAGSDTNSNSSSSKETKKRKSKSDKKRRCVFVDTKNEFLVKYQAVPWLQETMISIDCLGDYIKHNFGTLDEYEVQYAERFGALGDLPPEQATTANLPKHQKLNRYPDIYPSDDGLVQIKKTSENPVGYINASYVFKNHPNITEYNFIACQAPLENTVEDFYSMIWEQSINWIVMLTGYQENGEDKSYRYLPQKGMISLKCGLNITIKDVHIEHTNTLTTLEILNSKTNQKRIVKQIHYTTWPDKTNPTYSDMQEMLQFFIEKVPKHSPICIHCSAGVGRTGLFISCVVNWCDLKPKGLFNIDGVIRAMRETRCSMIQVPSQYMFAHLFLLYYLECDKEIKKSMLSKM